MQSSGFDGLLVIDKPQGMTSRDVVNRAQTWFPRHTRIGHTGTLDPLATGVLVLCVGQATRLSEYVQRMSKIYLAGIRLGGTSTTDDLDGQVSPTPAARTPPRAEVEEVLAASVGVFEQVPPDYSAVHVDGRRAYTLARRGKEVALTARTVTIHAIDVLSYTYPDLLVQVHCGKGTYIRSLARDAGQQLGCGGYITSLRRLQVGCFAVTQAASLDLSAAQARQHLLPTARAVDDLPRLLLPAPDAARLQHGQGIPLPDSIGATMAGRSEAALFDATGRLLAVVESANGMLRPGKVLLRAEAMSS